MSIVIEIKDITSEAIAAIMKYNSEEDQQKRCITFYEHINNILCADEVVKCLALEIKAYMLAAMLNNPSEDFDFIKVARRFFVLGICTGFDLSEKIVRDKTLGKLDTTITES